MKSIEQINPKIEMIAEESAENLKRLVIESSKEIEQLMINAAEEAMLQEKDAQVSIGFAITLNLDTNEMKHRLTWSEKHTREVSSEIPDPDQLKLPIEDQE